MSRGLPGPCWFGVLLVALLAATAAAQLRDQGTLQERRVALVIGNGNYAVGRLNNPVLDARAMTQTLRGLGFEVLAHENLNYQSMRRAVAGFGERIAGGGVALFYYSGHGLQVNGKNYLVPVDADIKSEAYVSAEAVDVDSALVQMQDAKTRVNIVILDACRDNPFARRFRSATRGLAFMDAPTGTYVAYATAPGSVAEDGEPGKNSVYTGELVKVLREPGLRIEDVFKRVRVAVQARTSQRQNPWDASSLTGDFFFMNARPEEERTAARTVHWKWDDRTIPGPPSVKITMRRADVPQGSRAFVGVWEGAWGQVLASRLVVESIEGDSARVVYGWADDPSGRFKGGWSENRAAISRDGKLSWGKEAVFIFELSPDLMSIEGKRVQGSSVSIVRMTRIGP